MSVRVNNKHCLNETCSVSLSWLLGIKMCYRGSVGFDVLSLSNGVIHDCTTGVPMSVSVFFPRPHPWIWKRAEIFNFWSAQKKVTKNKLFLLSICNHTSWPAVGGEKWLIEMLLKHLSSYRRSFATIGSQQPRFSTASVKTPDAENSRRCALPTASAFQRIKTRLWRGGDQKMAVTTQTGEAQHDKESTNIRRCAERWGFGRLLHPCETLEADACQKIVCSQREKQRISFKVEWKCRAHLIPEAARAYSAELIHREEELMNMGVDK